jgi:LacI family transcriptional regulator
MEDVAQRAGVSKATVSLVLNRKPGISPETQRTVIRAAEDLGYRLPERRPLRSPMSRTLTILYHVKDEFRAEPYSIVPSFLRGARTFARKAKVHLNVLAGYRREDLARIGVDVLNNEGLSTDGLILMGPGLCRDSKSVVQALQSNIPVVVLCRNWPDVPVSTVGHDHYEQAQIALDHLVDLGHRKVAFLAGEADEQYDWCQQRLSCYRQVITSITGETDKELIILAKDGASAVQALMARRPDVTAIFANHDTKAIEAMQGLQAMGLDVPKDVSVIGQDNAKPSPENCPTLTTVGFSPFTVGYLAAELLLKQIGGDEVTQGNIWVRSHLIERESCCKVRPV